MAGFLDWGFSQFLPPWTLWGSRHGNRLFVSTTRNPCFQESVGHCEHYRAYEKADDTKGYQAADDPGKDHNQRQIHPFSDKDRTDKIIEDRRKNHKDEQDASP